ncbi:MAG: C1 family peptidase [Ignavibacteria bacterium]|nr:C1 family peptidase [Ignavibacteria bacterium]
MELVKNSGCASRISFPYSDSDWNNLPSEKVRMDALKNRISDYRTVPISAENFKTELNEGYPIVIAFYLDNRFFEIVNAGGKYIWDGILGKEGNINDTACYYHAVTVIGCDEDTRLFEIMNSWGNDWASNGFFFIDYEVF